MPHSISASRRSVLAGVRHLWLVAVVLAGVSLPVAARAQTTIGLSSATIADLNRAFEAGTLTSERLVQMYIARIEAYDHAGPALNSVITLNPKALETARALDAERRQRGPRSPLHGIPVVLKDNFDTFDLPTTGGSVLLKGSIPPDDAFTVKKLRDAGAIIFAKVNMSEFASAATMSSMIGPMRNPHDVARSPAGSSGGTGVAIAAWFAQLGLGTDTGGSIRGPSTSNGVVGLKPTHGLLSRDGIIPLALTFDTGGPLARHVYDVAVMLGVMTGVDPADEATRKSEGRFETDYTRYLNAGALRGARIGIARDFMGADADVDWVIESALETMRKAGATIVDVRYPAWLVSAKADWYQVVRQREFRAQIKDYLAMLAPGYPKTLAEMIERAKRISSPPADGGVPNPVRWTLFEQEEASGELTDYQYVTMLEHGLPLVRGIVEGVIRSQNLDAIVYPTSPSRPGLVGGGGGGGGAGVVSATNIANLTGFPDLIVPAGFTGDRLPVGISFFGPAFSEGKLLGFGYAFEQATRARRDPVLTPALPGESIRLSRGANRSEAEVSEGEGSGVGGGEEGGGVGATP
ncbi:MAG: glutamyl-tRNA amidotransferase [Gemmatimonadetes bacterium]|nr:glutamyl-tRNA amidotransferase [Gemmatimonadota bacterium]